LVCTNSVSVAIQQDFASIVSGDIKYTFFLFWVERKKKRMSLVAIIWCEELQKLRDRAAEKEEEQRKGVWSSVQSAALTSPSTSHELELMAEEENRRPHFGRWLPSSSAVNKMMDCFCT